MRKVVVNGVSWFVIADICRILLLKNPSDLKSRIPKTDICKINIEGIKEPVNMTTSKGFFVAIERNNKLSEFKKLDLIDKLKIHGIESDKYFIYSRKENNFMNKLSTVLKQMDIDIIAQHKVHNYHVDGFIERFNIAIEYDEHNNHSNYERDKEELRQKVIENELKCEFIRLSDTKTDEENIGIVINSLFKKLFKIA